MLLSSFVYKTSYVRAKARRVTIAQIAEKCNSAQDRNMSEHTVHRSVMLWTMFYWEPLAPGIHVDDILTCANYLKIVADHVHPFMPMIGVQ